MASMRRPGRARGIPSAPLEALPDVRDGLSRAERVVLVVLQQAQVERGGRAVPTAELYGRVLEHLDLGEEELVRILGRLGAGPRR